MPAPKKKKVGRPRSRSALAVHRRPYERKNWTNESMEAALESIRNGQSILRAAKCHNVPRLPYRIEFMARLFMEQSLVQDHI